MGASYRLDVRSSAGVLQAVITDFNWLSYRRQVNAPGLLQFQLPAGHGAIQYLGDKAIVEVWRRDSANGVAPYRDFQTLVRGFRYAYPEEGPEHFLVWCPGVLSMLGWRVVAWPAGVVNRSVFTGVAAETIMKTVVDYNAGANATAANGRKRDGAITGISVQSDGARGNVLDWRCQWEGLLGTLRSLARVGGGDFDLVGTGPAAWQFRWYTGQLGTDRSATVTLALNYGNMRNPSYGVNRMDEATVAVVAGQGEGADRAVVVRTGANYAASNDIETFVNASSYSTTAGLNAAGDAALDAVQARNAFAFGIVQTPACVYGRDWGLGDLVRARYRSVEVTQKVVGVTVGLDAEGNETIGAEFTDA